MREVLKMKAIQIEGLVKKMVDGTPILDGVNLEVKKGEFVSLVGPQANGKSTLLRLTAGLDKPTSGSIKINDSEISGPSQDVGMIFQETVLYPWMKIIDNVTFGPLSRGLEKEVAREKAEEWLQTLGLGKFLDKWPYELSGGMQRRATIAMVMVNNPPILLCDELLGGLDLITRNQIADEFLRIWQDRKLAVLYVTHLLEEAVYLSQRVYVMSSQPGKIYDELEINLPEKRWEVPNLRFSKECVGYVSKVRKQFENAIQSPQLSGSG